MADGRDLNVSDLVPPSLPPTLPPTLPPARDLTRRWIKAKVLPSSVYIPRSPILLQHLFSFSSCPLLLSFSPPSSSPGVTRPSFFPFLFLQVTAVLDAHYSFSCSLLILLSTYYPSIHLFILPFFSPLLLPFPSFCPVLYVRPSPFIHIHHPFSSPLNSYLTFIYSPSLLDSSLSLFRPFVLQACREDQCDWQADGQND